MRERFGENGFTKDKKTKIFLFIGLVVLILATLEGVVLLSSEKPSAEILERSFQSKSQRITYFLLDGLDFEVFNGELKAGNLPEVSKMIEEGVYIPKVITSFPSMTGYGFWPLITGYDATQSGLISINSF